MSKYGCCANHSFAIRTRKDLLGGSANDVCMAAFVHVVRLKGQPRLRTRSLNAEKKIIIVNTIFPALGLHTSWHGLSPADIKRTRLSTF